MAEDGRSARFLLFEPCGVGRQLRSLRWKPHRSKPRISRLAYLPSSRPPRRLPGMVSLVPSLLAQAAADNLTLPDVLRH